MLNPTDTLCSTCNVKVDQLKDVEHVKAPPIVLSSTKEKIGQSTGAHVLLSFNLVVTSILQLKMEKLKEKLKGVKCLPWDRIIGYIKTDKGYFLEQMLCKHNAEGKLVRFLANSDDYIKQSLKNEFPCLTPTFEDLYHESETDSNKDLYLLERLKKRQGEI